MKKRKPAPKPMPRPMPAPKPMPRPIPNPRNPQIPTGVGGVWGFPEMSDEERKNLNNPNNFWRGKDRGFIQVGSLSDMQARWKEMPQEQKDELIGSYISSNPNATASDFYATFSGSPRDEIEFSAIPRGMAGRGDFNYDSAMAQQTYNNLMQQQMAFLDAQRAAQNAPTSPTGFGSMAAQLQARNMLPSQNQQQNVPTLMPIQTPQSAAANQALSQAGLGGGIPSPVQQGTAQQQQAMQNYQNFLSQGTANYQAAMQQPFSPAMPKPMPAPKKPSTSSFQTPRPFG